MHCLTPLSHGYFQDKLNQCATNCDANKAQKGHNSNTIQAAFNDCLWVCYNKLERRYTEYWKKQKEETINRHGS